MKARPASLAKLNANCLNTTAFPRASATDSSSRAPCMKADLENRPSALTTSPSLDRSCIAGCPRRPHVSWESGVKTSAQRLPRYFRRLNSSRSACGMTSSMSSK